MFESIIAFDAAFSLLMQSIANPAFTLLMQAFSFALSSTGVMFITAWLYWSKREKESFYFASLIVFAAFFSEFFKQLFQRLRPGFSGFGIKNFEIHSPSDYSFPSGHTTLAGGLFGYLEKGLNKNWKIILVFAVFLVSFSRIYLGSHFLSDVLAGLVLGFFVGKLNLAFRKKTEHMHFKLSKIKEEALLFAFVTVSVIIVLFLKELVLAAVMIGYFAGYSLLKELQIEQSGQSLKRKILGFFGIGVLYLASRHGSLEQQYIVLFLMGFWVSFLQPLMFESLKRNLKAKGLKKARKH